MLLWCHFREEPPCVAAVPHLTRSLFCTAVVFCPGPWVCGPSSIGVSRTRPPCATTSCA